VSAPTPHGPEERHRRAPKRRLVGWSEPRGAWRWLVLVAFGAAGVLFVTSSIDAQGGDLRSASVTDLSTLVRDQRSDTDASQTRVATLNREVNALTRQVNDKEVDRLQGQVDQVRGPAGLAPVSGEGLTVTLEDAPQDVLDKAIADGSPPADTLVVHQQDIQAVVNALWLGGATAISIMNQRIISTTGIKCAGPTVILHGVPYSPPYVIRAVGDTTDLQAALDASDYIDAYRVVADRYGLGYGVRSSSRLDLPGYEGTLELRYATQLGQAG
jgi:uncharacterized protein YlxW (UPF0749 family)